VLGADIHIDRYIVDKLVSGELPRLANSRYFLFEPPHHVLPPGFFNLCEKLIQTGFIPVLTHPERFTWIENQYPLICKLDELGVGMQLTAMSIIGNFGKRAQYWSDRIRDEGRVDIIASDAHNTRSRPPGLSKARDVISEKLGKDEVSKIVHKNPANILENYHLRKKNKMHSKSY
jgi:protein-tyrosine phosphatase